MFILTGIASVAYTALAIRLVQMLYREYKTQRRPDAIRFAWILFIVTFFAACFSTVYTFYSLIMRFSNSQ